MPKLHPAVKAIREVARTFSTAHECGSCFASDIKQDERVIASSPDQPFAWLMGAYGTHIMPIGRGYECLLRIHYHRDGVEIDRRHRNDHRDIIRSISGDYPELYMWDGVALTRATDPNHLIELYERAILRSALAEAESEVVACEREQRAIALDDYRERVRLLQESLQ